MFLCSSSLCQEGIAAAQMASAFHLVFFLWMSSGLLIAGTGSAALPDDSKAPCCPPFWTRFGSRCFIFQNKPVTFDRAESMCQALGGNLASIHNQNENMFIRELIHKATGSHPSTWIGGHDGVKEGHWMWTDGTKFDYSPWGLGQPDNGGGKENCAHTNWKGPFWNDAPCTANLPLVCSKNP